MCRAPKFWQKPSPHPLLSFCSRAAVHITWLWWTSVRRQLSPAFLCIIRLPEKPEKHHPSKAFDQCSEGAGGICTAAMLRSRHAAAFVQLPFGHFIMT